MQMGRGMGWRRSFCCEMLSTKRQKNLRINTEKVRYFQKTLKRRQSIVGMWVYFVWKKTKMVFWERQMIGTCCMKKDENVSINSEVVLKLLVKVFVSLCTTTLLNFLKNLISLISHFYSVAWRWIIIGDCFLTFLSSNSFFSQWIKMSNGY